MGVENKSPQNVPPWRAVVVVSPSLRLSTEVQAEAPA